MPNTDIIRTADLDYQAACAKCGQAFNPCDAADLVHLSRGDGTECCGTGALIAAIDRDEGTYYSLNQDWRTGLIPEDWVTVIIYAQDADDGPWVELETEAAPVSDFPDEWTPGTAEVPADMYGDLMAGSPVLVQLWDGAALIAIAQIIAT